MTAIEIIETAKLDTEVLLNSHYKNLCEEVGCDVQKEIESDKLSGEYYREFERLFVKRLFKLIREVKSGVFSDKEKEEIIREIHNCKEYRRMETKVLSLIADHLIKHKDIYLK